MNLQNLISLNDTVGNKETSDESLDKLVTLMPKYGFTDIVVYPKNSYEQTQLGIDLKFFKGDSRFSADHKSRSPKWGHKGLFTLELVNNAGFTGSLFKGTQDYFILEGSKNFVFIDPKDLIRIFNERVDTSKTPLLSNSPEAFDYINKQPKLHTLLTRSYCKRSWDNKPNEDKFAWFTYQEVNHLINQKIPIEA